MSFISKNFVQIFSCGGTIDKVYFDAKSQFQVGEPQIDTIFRNANVDFEYAIHSVLRKDSLDMTDLDRRSIHEHVAVCQATRVLITHGTDTMTHTAESLVGIPGKTIVLTGSMMPARFQASDAEFNIGCAVGALCSRAPGVYIAMNGDVFVAGTVRKNVEAGRFELL